MITSRIARLLKILRITVIITLLIGFVWFLEWMPNFKKFVGAAAVSFLQIASVILILWLGYRWWRQQRTPSKIFRFRNLTGDVDKKEEYDALAYNFADLLVLEINRIINIRHSEDVIPQSIAIRQLALGKKKVPRWDITTSRPSSSAKTITDDQLRGAVERVGDFSFGPINVPLGNLLSLVLQAVQGGGISGSLQKYGAVLSIVATHKNNIWEVRSDSLPISAQGEETVAQELAHQLAYKILADILTTTTRDWRSFRELTDGLVQYRRYLKSGRRNFKALKKAQKFFEHAIVFDPQYAWAFFNLGLTYDEENEINSAIEMYKIAIELDPQLTEAHFHLGRVNFETGKLPEAINSGERAVEQIKLSKKLFLPARTSLAGWLESASRIEIQEGYYEAARDYCQRSIAHYKAALDEYEQLLKKASRHKQDSLVAIDDLNADYKQTWLKISKAYILLAQINEVLIVSDTIRRKSVKRIFKKAEQALKRALNLEPDNIEILLELSWYYRDQENVELSHQYLERAEKLNPEDTSVFRSFGESFLRPSTDALIKMIGDIDSRDDQLKGNGTTIDSEEILDGLTLAGQNFYNTLKRELEQGEPTLETWLQLAGVQGGVAVFKSEVKKDQSYQDDINFTIALLGKAMFLFPFEPEVYAQLANAYIIKQRLESRFKESDTTDDEPSEEETNDRSGEISNHNGIVSDTQRMIDVYNALHDMISLPGGNQSEYLIPELGKLAFNIEKDKLIGEEKTQIPPPEEARDDRVVQLYLWLFGWLLVKAGLSETAMPYLNRALKMGPFPEAEIIGYELGNIFRELKHWEEAVDYFNSVVEQDPYFWESRISLAETYFEWAEYDKTFKNAYEKAIEVYDQAIAYAGMDVYRMAQVLAGRAEAYRLNGELNPAIQDCQKAASLVPAYEYPYMVLAMIYMDLYDYDKAIENWNSVADLIPDVQLFEYHQGLGNAYFQKYLAMSDQKDSADLLEKAINAYEQAIHLCESNTVNAANTAAALGNTHYISKNYMSAKLAYQRSIELGRNLPDVYRFHIGLGEVFVKLKSFGEAEQEFKRAIKFCEENLKKAQEDKNKTKSSIYAEGLGTACNLLAYDIHAERTIKLDEGLMWVNKALETLEWIDNKDQLNEIKGAYLDTRGWIFYKQKEYDKALQDLEQALELTKGTAYEHAHLALVYERKAELITSEAERAIFLDLAREQWEFVRDMDSEGEWADSINKYMDR
ncbi:MAG: tetratricopeptide repeat protein [Desulfobacteraceae bacterium]